MSYSCNCGRMFETQMQRTAHKRSCTWRPPAASEPIGEKQDERIARDVFFDGMKRVQEMIEADAKPQAPDTLNNAQNLNASEGYIKAPEPREWWITLHKNEFDAVVPLHAFASRDKAFDERAHEHVHVIEYSAFERCKSERNALQAEWQKEHTEKVDCKVNLENMREQRDHFVNVRIAEYLEAKNKLARTEKALEYAKDMIAEVFKLSAASAALAQIERMRKGES